MKRSEAIEAIAKAKNAAYGINWEDLEYPLQLMDLQVAAYILHVIEEAGMLPPQLPNISSYDLAMGGNYNKWEVE